MFNFLRRKTHVVLVWRNRGEQRYYYGNGQTTWFKHYAERFTEQDAEKFAEWLESLGVPAVAIRY